MSRSDVTSVSNLPSWLTMVAQIYPPKHVVLVGAGNGTGLLVQWLLNHASQSTEAGQCAPAVNLLEPHAPSMAQLAKRLAAKVQCTNWQLQSDMLSPTEGNHAYHQFSLAAENGLLPLEALRPLWPGLQLQSQQLTSGVSLESLVPSSWLLIDCLPAAQLLEATPLSETADEAVLVIDQTYGDMSVQFGAANQHTFMQMLQAAIDENPGAQIWIKTHPEVSSGSKRGYLSQIQTSALPKGGQLLLLRELANPIGLLQQVNKVYVATSGMGFEALLCAKPVRCFGLPWYAGWGVTEDEQYCPRRIRTRSIQELFAAAYLRYTRYLNPVTHKQGSIFDVMTWLIRQRQMAGLA